MVWFKPQTLLDKTYEIGILLKGIDGVLELVGAAALLFIPVRYFQRFSQWIADLEAGSSHHGFISTHIAHFGHSLAEGNHVFAILFLFTHGLVKVVLVACLLRNKLWAYPFGLVALTLFLGYQLYEMVIHPTFGMGFLTVLDIVIIWLVWREWRQVKADRSGSGSKGSNSKKPSPPVAAKA